MIKNTARYTMFIFTITQSLLIASPSQDPYAQTRTRIASGLAFCATGTFGYLTYGYIYCFQTDRLLRKAFATSPLTFKSRAPSLLFQAGISSLLSAGSFGSGIYTLKQSFKPSSENRHNPLEPI